MMLPRMLAGKCTNKQIRHSSHMSQTIIFMKYCDVLCQTGIPANTVDSRYLEGPQDPFKYFKISVFRLIRFAELREK